MGGMDQEDEAQGIGEPSLPTLLSSENEDFGTHFLFEGQNDVLQSENANESIHEAMAAFVAPPCGEHLPSPLPSDVASSSISPTNILRKRFVPKRPRESGGSPPRKFQWAHERKEKQD